MQQRYYEQRSKVKWIPNVDKNTKYFHMSVLQRKKKNQIAALKLPNDSWVTDANDIVQYLVEHFTRLFKRDPDEMKHPIQFQSTSKIDNASDDNISMVPMKEEVWNTIKRMKSLKAPGPDGMPSLFYKQCWELVGDEMICCYSVL